MGKIDERNRSTGSSNLFKNTWINSLLLYGIVFAVLGIAILILIKFFNIGDTPLFLDVKAFVAEYGLVGIFFATILAGTVVPLGSPALVVAAALLGVPKIPLIFVATTGFTIGMAVNYGLSYYLGRPYITKKMSAEKLEELTRLWERWGWMLYTVFGLIPVLPVELLAFLCGFLKTRLDHFLVLSFVPRLIVFLLLAYFGEHVGVWIGV
jgi:membrane protein YqaA with SNARE-associated domain